MHREFKAVFLFVFISYGLSASSQANSAENPQVTVSVYDYAQLPLDTLTGAEQRIPIVVEVVRIARQSLIRPLAVEHHLHAVGCCQLHEVEPGNRRSRVDRLVLEPQDL